MLNRETPPRAWGRLNRILLDFLKLGNTPTGVGKTGCLACRGECLWKHPHGRGEDRRYSCQAPSTSETPPRAWGRQSAILEVCVVNGNTPTGVGKTSQTASSPAPAQKHPHGRGEDSAPGIQHCINLETPPRAWGRPTFTTII